MNPRRLVGLALIGLATVTLSACRGATPQNPLFWQVRATYPANYEESWSSVDILGYSATYTSSSVNLSIETRGPNVLATSGPWINDTNEHTHLIWYIETTGDDTPDFIVKSVLANPGTFTWPSSVVTTAGGSQTCVGTFRNSDGDHTTLEMVLDPQSCFGGIGPLRFSAELAINTGLPTAPDIVTDSAPKPSNTSGAVQPQFSMWVAPRRDPAPYANCAAAKADKATPLHIGDPGYSPQLDADGDGVACEA